MSMIEVRTMAETRRGRKSQASYRELVAKALLADRFALEESPVLSQLPAIERWVSDHEHELLPHGKALHIALHQAIQRVIATIGDADDVQLVRVVQYLRWRYVERVSVKQIAEQGGCSSVHVWRTAGCRALDMVTDAFLAIARSSRKDLEAGKLVRSEMNSVELTTNYEPIMPN
jgi:hypothetical protein